VPFVLDASTAVAWYLPDEDDAGVQAALAKVRSDVALVPPGWAGEVANAFLFAERRRRITEGETAVALADLRRLNVRVVPTPHDAWDRALELARAHRLTAYDAAYLDLALRERAPLATIDDELRAAAQRLGVPLVA